MLVLFGLTFININSYPGADVGHPGPGVTKPSVTGIVFLYDEGATRYAALIEIHDFDSRLPRRVIFRDGVSEGEYNTMATAEIATIQGTY